VRILLDENFSLALHKALREAGHVSEHIIELGLRGATDAQILERLSVEEWLFLTQDSDFLGLPPGLKSIVLVSHVPQDIPTRTRVAIWLRAIDNFLRARPVGRLFELDAQGRVHPIRGTSS